MEFLLPGHKSPSLTQTKRKQGDRPGPNISAVTGHTPRRRGSWIPGSLAPGHKLEAWISTDPIANFPQVPRPLLRCWPLSPAHRASDQSQEALEQGCSALPTFYRPSDPHNSTGFWNPRLPRLPNFPQALIIPLDSRTKVPSPPQHPPRPQVFILFLGSGTRTTTDP